MVRRLSAAEIFRWKGLFSFASTFTAPGLSAETFITIT